MNLNFKKTLTKKVSTIKEHINFFKVKTKLKHIVRSIAYNKIVTQIITSLIAFYIKLVYFTSRKTFIGEDNFLDLVKNSKSSILACWHSHLMMMPCMSFKIKKANPQYQYFSLASKHGDGRFVSKTVAKFGTQMTIFFLTKSFTTSRVENRLIFIYSIRP